MGHGWAEVRASGVGLHNVHVHLEVLHESPAKVIATHNVRLQVIVKLTGGVPDVKVLLQDIRREWCQGAHNSKRHRGCEFR